MNNGLPHNIEAEKALIGSAFWSYGSLQKVCEEVSSEVFYLDSHSKIFEVIKSLYQEKKPVDIGTVTSEVINRGLLLQIGGVEYLTSVVVVLCCLGILTSSYAFVLVITRTKYWWFLGNIKFGNDSWIFDNVAFIKSVVFDNLAAVWHIIIPSVNVFVGVIFPSNVNIGLIISDAFFNIFK